MTNAEKYLKDGVDKRELFEEICLVFYDGGYGDFDVSKLEEFFNEQVKPALTEDERVILRNINTEVYDVIGRDSDFDLYIAGKVDWNGNKVSTKDNIEQFLKDNVFQFIKERRRI